MSDRFIYIKNAQTHNLKGIDVYIPHNKLVVITGVSGSGKTSLAYDTLHAEGHRRYIESLSSYARQFVERLPKPPVDYIKGLSPCIALEQKVSTNNPRSTVGTATEIYDYLRVLFARVGRIYHPHTGQEIKRHYAQDVLEFIQNTAKSFSDASIFIATEVSFSSHSSIHQTLENLISSGFSRVLIHHEIHKLTEVINHLPKSIQSCFLIIDRIATESFDEENISRIYDSIETAFNQGNGTCYVVYKIDDAYHFKKFSHSLEIDGISFEDPTPDLFAFNNAYGLCSECKGTGKTYNFDIKKVITNTDSSIEKIALTSHLRRYKKNVLEYLNPLRETYPYLFSTPIYLLSKEDVDILWYGKDKLPGICHYLKEKCDGWISILSWPVRESLKSYVTCPSCKGSRLRKEALYVKVLNKTIAEYVEMPVNELLEFFKKEVSEKVPYKSAVERLIKEIISRLEFLCDVGLSYLTLNREMRSLSGGESQRVYLTTAVGSSLVGSIYVLDEPTTGLHPRDTHRLIHTLKKLRDEGNTVVLVEHDEEVIRQADYIIDMGPGAGKEGGKIMFQGNIDHIAEAKESLTAQYLLGKKTVHIHSIKRPFNDFIYLKHATANNLKNISIQFPFNAITCITGVSGSGKSSLVEEEIIPEIEKIIIHNKVSHKLSGSIHKIKHIHYISQHSVNISTRSTCATYTGMYDYIRSLFAQYARYQGLNFFGSHFSFNVPGGRCDNCEGEGIVRIPMQFMADIEMICEECKGKRFKKDVLQVNYNGVNISDVLEATVDEAYELFKKETQETQLAQQILKILEILKLVGLGYLPLGQSTSKMSGGELQRLKIATFLQQEKQEPSLFILDEPSTGLHFHDIDQLMNALQQLIRRGHTIIIVEHQLDIIKNADWIIDLGPEGGKNGGQLVFQGPIDEFLECTQSYTAQYLTKKLAFNY